MARPLLRVGVLADTHIPARAKALPPAMLEAFAGVDLILHAGDLVDPQVLEWLRAVAPVEAVAGNNDPPSVALGLGWNRELELGGYKVCLTHGHLGTGKSTVERALSQFPEADCVIFGHSHVAHCQWRGRTLALNPGSATDRRRSPRCSYAILTVASDGLHAEIHYLER